MKIEELKKNEELKKQEDFKKNEIVNFEKNLKLKNNSKNTKIALLIIRNYTSNLEIFSYSIHQKIIKIINKSIFYNKNNLDFIFLILKQMIIIIIEKIQNLEEVEDLENSEELSNIMKIENLENTTKTDKNQNSDKTTKTEKNQNSEITTKTEKNENSEITTKTKKKQNSDYTTKTEKKQNSEITTKTEKKQNSEITTKTDINKNSEIITKTEKNQKITNYIFPLLHILSSFRLITIKNFSTYIESHTNLITCLKKLTKTKNLLNFENKEILFKSIILPILEDFSISLNTSKFRLRFNFFKELSESVFFLVFLFNCENQIFKISKIIFQNFKIEHFENNKSYLNEIPAIQIFHFFGSEKISKESFEIFFGTFEKILERAGNFCKEIKAYNFELMENLKYENFFNLLNLKKKEKNIFFIFQKILKLFKIDEIDFFSIKKEQLQFVKNINKKIYKQDLFYNNSFLIIIRLLELILEEKFFFLEKGQIFGISLFLNKGILQLEKNLENLEKKKPEKYIILLYIKSCFFLLLMKLLDFKMELKNCDFEKHDYLDNDNKFENEIKQNLEKNENFEFNIKFENQKKEILEKRKRKILENKFFYFFEKFFKISEKIRDVFLGFKSEKFENNFFLKFVKIIFLSQFRNILKIFIDKLILKNLISEKNLNFDKKKIVKVLLKYLTFLKIPGDFCNFCENCFLCQNFDTDENSMEIIQDYIFGLIN